MSKTTFIILSLVLGLMTDFTVQAQLQELTASEVLNFKTLHPDSLVFFVDSREKTSQAFLDVQLKELTQKIQESFPDLKLLLADQKNILKDAKSSKLGTQDPLWTKLKIFDFPTITLYSEGNPAHFYAYKNLDKFMIALKARLDARVTEISDPSGAVSQDSKNLAVFYFSTKSKVEKTVKKIAKQYFTKSFYKVENAETLISFANSKGLEIKRTADPLIISYRQEDESVRRMTADEKEKGLTRAFHSFIHRSSVTLAGDFDKYSVDKLNNEFHDTIILTVNKEQYASQISYIKKRAEKKYKKLFALVIDEANQEGKDFLESLGLPVTYPGAYYLTKKLSGKYAKYIMDDPEKMTSKTLREFISDSKEDVNLQFYRTEAEPSTDLYPNVKTLVGSTIDNHIFESKENRDLHHVIFFYDHYTSTALPQFALLADKLRHEKIKFYIFNTDSNESDNVKSSHEGNILLFSKGLKVKKTFMLPNKESVKGLSKFLEKNLKKDGQLGQALEEALLHQDL